MKITQEMTFKTYEDNKLINFEVVLTKNKGRSTVQIFGLETDPLGYESLCKVIKALKSAKKNWESVEKFETE